MRARNVNPLDLEVAAYSAGVGLRIGPDSFRLQAQGNSWRMRDSRGRLTSAVCLHGHWLFFRYLFERVPRAEVRTSIAPHRLTASTYESAARLLARNRELPLCECPRGVENRTAGISLNCDRCTDTLACDDHRYHDRDYF